MGLLDSNKILVEKYTGMEGSNFELLSSNEYADIYRFVGKGGRNANYLKLSYRDTYAWSGDYARRLYLVKGKITDNPVEVVVNDTNFPGLRRYSSTHDFPTIDKVVACPYDHNKGAAVDGTDLRVCVIFSNGQVYYNYPNTNGDEEFAVFKESVIWDLPNKKNPTNDASLVATGAYYLNPALDNVCYEMHPAITSDTPSTINKDGLRARFFRTNMEDSNANSMSYMGGYVIDNRFTMIGTYRGNIATPARTCIFGTQDGGKNWYVMYEFSGGGTLKYTRDDGKIINITIEQSGIPLHQVGTASSGIYSIKRRISIVPSIHTKEPLNRFEYETPVNISSIVGTTSSITINTESVHGFVNGDVLVVEYQSGVVANNREFDWMVNNTTTNNSGGNGVLFRVTNAQEKSFTVTLMVHNADNNLSARHIHCMNKCKDGVSVGCGEDYPAGGWILYDFIPDADSYDGYDVTKSTKNTWIRLNSGNTSFSRPLGVIIQQEGTETYCYIGVDTAHIRMNDVKLPEGRTDVFKHNCTGVWKVKLADIDDISKADMLYNCSETCFGFQQIGTAMVFCGQYGNLAISYDNGKSWMAMQMPQENKGSNLCHFSGMTFDRKFSIDNVLVQLKK